MVDLADPTFWIPQLIAVTLVIVTYADTRRRLKEDRQASKAMLELIAMLRQQADSRGSLSQQQLAMKERELKLKESMATLKGLKFIADTARSMGLFDED